MDSHKDFATRAHDMGWRAYRQYDGLFIQRHDGSGFYVTDRDSIKDWHALRAYQDEQRKKAPMVREKEISGREWIYRDYYAHSFCAVHVQGFYEPVPEIWVYPDETGHGHPIGRWKNLRWREGYPKVIGDGVVDLSESPLVYRYPKTGIAGNVIRIEDAQL